MMHLIINKLISTDANIRRIYKVRPILGPHSVSAARTAIASSKQGKFLALHEMMMKANSSFNLPSILGMAKLAGLNTTPPKMNLKRSEVGETLHKILLSQKNLNSPVQLL